MCIESLLGLHGCNIQEPSTGLYIDDLGINKTFLGQLITDQFINGEELFINKRKMAWRKLSSSFISRINPLLKVDTLIENKRIGQALNNSSDIDPLLGTGKYAGIRLIIDPNNESYLNFQLSELKIDIYTMATPVQILVFDMATLKLIDSFNYQSESIEEYIGKTFKAKKRKLDLAFVYESLWDTTKMVTRRGACNDCGGRIREAHICPFVDAVGIELTTDGFNVLSSKAKKYTQGMSITYNVSCDRESWLCSIGGLMAMALAYGTAVELFNYALTISPNQRVNTAVSINKGNKVFATSDATEGIVAARDIAASNYDEELTNLFSNLRLPDDRHCFDCRKNVKYVTALP
jgi:hypothetical protein